MAGAHAVVPASPALLAAVGMAACLGAAARSPFAITVIAAETCWSGWVLAAALLAVPVAVKLMGSDTLYRAQPLNRKELTAQPGGTPPTVTRSRSAAVLTPTAAAVAGRGAGLRLTGRRRPGSDAASRTVAAGTQSRHNGKHVHKTSAEAAS